MIVYFLFKVIANKFITINEVQLIPPLPLIRGTNVNLKGIVHIHKKIDWMMAKFLITYNFRHELNITFVDENLNGCDLIADILKQNCPLLPGRYNLSATQEVLKLYWPGFYEGKFTIYNENGDQLFCEEMSLLMK
ncbi:PREDICTED: uncharacterized protein LOC109581733 [Amphimedon queenslandica]|uniref:MD-2-related lipid-recognition domain-containing protein n=1 Tax=Amphimedon queenslandica TaxID=400682 RepID=A0AAN0J4I1_AMPQE|nr:PREDICTED: uncharacterized protein LOC109581733 [Amphimedon queenslandica]|eukprot:XP_019851657.1 PREDICTED: uncharacterized protein LOC109581733 [Amphimedon queenslandica]